MATKKGQFAKVTLTIDGIDVDVLKLRNWSYTASVEELDTTAAGEEWMSYVAGFKSWEGEAETIDVDTFYLQYLGEIATIKFYEAEGDTNYEEGQAFLTEFEKSAPYDDLIEQSISFRGTGPLVRQPNI
jgi:predicted secreted protein